MTAFVGVDLVSMTSPDVVRGFTVLVRGEKIVSVAPSGDVEVPAGATIVEGGTLLPGLIDAHVHVRARAALDLYLAHGFTTVRNMNGNFGDPARWRDEIASGQSVGPRVLSSSPTMLSDPFKTYPSPQTAEEGRETARRFHGEGYDLIKVFRVKRSAFLALMAEARALGIPVAGHVPDVTLDAEPGAADSGRFGISFEEVVGSGITSLEHILEISRAATGGTQELEALRRGAESLTAADVAVGTLFAADLKYQRLASSREAYLAEHGDDIRRLLGEPAIEVVRAMSFDGFTPTEPEWAMTVVRTFHEAGVKLILGTDSHHPSLIAGLAGTDELGALVDAGLTPYQALETATSSAAQVLGLGTEVGRVEPGMTADLILVDGNPLADIRAVRKLHGVMTRGLWLDRAALDDLLEDAANGVTWCAESNCDQVASASSP